MTNEHPQPRRRDSLRSSLFTAGGYAIAASLWIIVSDRAAEWLFQPAGLLTMAQTYKGLGFVAVTSGILFLVLYHQFRRRAEIEAGLRESEEKFAAAFRASPVALTITTMDGKIVEANQTFCSLIGYTREELLGKTSIDVGIFTTETRQEWADSLRREGGWLSYVEKTFLDRHGASRTVLYSVETITFHGAPHLLTTCQEITERKQTEEALSKSERKYRALFSEMQLGSAVYEAVLDDAGRLVDFVTLDVNDAFTRLLGASRESAIGARASQLMSDKELAEWLETFGSVATTGNSTRYERYSDFKQRYYEGTAYSPEKDKFAITFSDITERKRAEEALRESEERYHSLFDNTLDALMVADDDGHHVDVNPAACLLFGYTREEMLKMGIYDTAPLSGRSQVKSLWTEFITAGEATGEYTVLCKDGTTREVEFRAVANVQPGLHMTAMRDITERNRTEEALRHERDLLHALMDNIPDGIYFKDVRSRFTRINEAQAILLGISTPQEAVDKTDFDFYTADFAQEAYDDEQRIVKMGEPLIGKVEQIKWPSGQVRWVSATKVPIHDQSGQVTGIVGITRDITNLKQAEEALRESEERFQQLADNIDEVFFLLDIVNDKYLYISPAHEKIWGRPAENFNTYADFLSAIHPDDRESIRLPEHPDDYRPTVEFRIVRPGGEIRWLRIYAYPIQDDQGQVVRMAGIAQDITIERQAQAAEQEQRTLTEALAKTAAVVNSTLDLSQVLRQILDNVGLAVPHDAAEVWLIEGDNVRVVGSRGHARRGGEAALLAVRLPVDEINNLRLARETVQPVLIGDTREFDGWIDLEATTWVRSLVTVPIQVGGEVLGFLNLLSANPYTYTVEQAGHLQTFASQVATAIQNARLYEELESYSESLERAVKERTAELRQTKERVEAILNYNPDPILLLKADGSIDAANPAFQRVFGYQVDALYRQTPFDLIAPGHAEALQAALGRAIDRRSVERLEVVARHQDGSSFDAEVALAPISVENSLLGVVCNLRDISALKEVARMKDAFVSNVSHELRTPITGLKLNHKLITMNPEKSPVYLDRLGREIDRLNALIEDLLRLSRLDQERVPLDLKPVDLNTLIAQYVNDRALLAESRGLALDFEQGENLPPALADEGLIGQAFSALLTNALNYTPTGGQVTVSTQGGQFDGKRWVEFRVSDNGPGIAPEEQPRLFERFYRGSAGFESGVPGTGLGLAIANEIVDRHGGHIEAANRGDVSGAIFTVWLPVAEGES
jgi:PAS domain S-box-containing protein